MRVCVVIPAYNEGKVIKNVIKKARKEFEKAKHEIDIVLINDGSADNTADEAKKAGAKIINHILNSGAGGATATGLSFANQKKYDLAVTMDADGQHSPKDVISGIDFAIKNNIDLAIGSRLIDSRGMSRVKVLGNKGLSFITYILFGVNVTDSQSGLRVYSRKALEQLRWKTSGYEFCSEMIWRANQLHLKIAEYPIEAIYTDYSRAKGQNNWNAINIVKSLVARRISEIFE